MGTLGSTRKSEVAARGSLAAERMETNNPGNIIDVINEADNQISHRIQGKIDQYENKPAPREEDQEMSILWSLLSQIQNKNGSITRVKNLIDRRSNSAAGKETAENTARVEMQ